MPYNITTDEFELDGDFTIIYPLHREYWDPHLECNTDADEQIFSDLLAKAVASEFPHGTVEFCNEHGGSFDYTRTPEELAIDDYTDVGRALCRSIEALQRRLDGIYLFYQARALCFKECTAKMGNCDDIKSYSVEVFKP